MSKNQEPIITKTFNTIDELYALEDFKHNNPLTKDNHDSIFGDYYFTEEVRCCYQKPNEKQCNEGHKFGYVAKLKDGSLTIIGNNCAKNNFDANSKLTLDRKKYDQEKQRQEKIRSLTTIRDQKDLSIEKLAKGRTQTSQLLQSASDFLNQLGSLTKENLLNRAKTVNFTVVVIGLTYNIANDKEKETRKKQ